MGATKHREMSASNASSRDSTAPRRLDRTDAADLALPVTFTARLVALDERGRAWIAADDDATVLAAQASGRASRSAARPSPLVARSTVRLAPEHVGREVLACRANRAGELVIVGLLTDAASAESTEEDAIDLVIERRRVILSAKTEVVLRCGEGSITLGADGKVTIRGIDVVSSASRTQRIRGGAVRIN
jgi:hypothetical protein